MCMNNIDLSKMSTRCNLDCIEPVHDICFRIYQIQWIAIQLKGNNKEEKMKRENEWKWPKCFGNLGRNLQTQKGKQNDSEESQWQGFSLQMMEIA